MPHATIKMEIEVIVKNKAKVTDSDLSELEEIEVLLTKKLIEYFEDEHYQKVENIDSNYPKLQNNIITTSSLVEMWSFSGETSSEERRLEKLLKSDLIKFEKYLEKDYNSLNMNYKIVNIIDSISISCTIEDISAEYEFKDGQYIEDDEDID